MSVESTTLERSALERKARDELAVIAQHLGLKPRSRDRKAEIVQAILEKTGVETGSNGAPPQTDATGLDEPGSQDRDEGGAPVAQSASEQSNTEPSPPTDQPRRSAGPEGQLSLDAAPAGAASAGGGQAQERSKTDDKVVELTNHDAQTQAEQASSSGREAPADAGPAEARSGSEKTDVGQSSTGRSSGDQAGTDKAEGKDSADTKTVNGEKEATGDGGQKKTDDRRDQQGQRQGQRSQGQRDQRNGQKGGGQQGGGGDVEAGNRRRRRRGRNRGGESAPEEYTGEPIDVEGLLDLREEGYGFLRVRGTRPSKEDIYVSVKQARQFGLRKGDHVKGGSRPALRNEKNPALLRIDQVNGEDPEKARQRRKFGDLTPLFPDEKLSLEVADDPSNMTSRIIDLISPIGKGQRGLIVSPPKAGKTTIMKQIVRSIEINNPEVKLIVLLVDERPEEVTDMRRWLRSPNSEVQASTFDRPADEHTHVAELSIERAKRLVEEGEDVCIVLDGITRLARAYNLAAPATGRIMSGGVDSGALYPPKKFFGAARNVEEGGSLTILATALIETGSKMDEVIFEEFKGTGNMELRLDRRLSERRIYPAIDVDASSTRHEELLFPRGQLNLVWALRRVLSGLSSTDGGNGAALELLIDRMKTFRTNDEFLAEVAKNRLAAG